MPTDVTMPQMGESITEGTITKWLVQIGDRVERDQPLFEISTDKVDAEIPSPAAGVLLEIKHDEGETVPVDEVVAVLGEKGESSGAGAAQSESEPQADAGGDQSAAPESTPAATEEPAPAARESGDASQEEAPADAAADEERVRKHSSPVVRKIAAEEGIDLEGVEGSGIHGRVTKRDIEQHLAKRADEPPAAPASTREAEVVPRERRDPGEFSVAAYTDGENVQIEPMSKIRQLTAAHMVYSKATSAHVTTVFHMDLSRVARTRARAKQGFLEAHGTKLTYMPFIFKAVASALKANPKLNAAVDGSNIVYKKDINLGMAVALDWGLLVPVLRQADQLNLVGLAKTANDLAERARSKRLSPNEVQGGTFTITNPGVFGTLFGTPIINQPQVAILGLGVIEKRPVVDTDSEGNSIIAIKTMSYFAITYDHRLIDGADADHFMNDVKRTLTQETWTELDPFVGG